MVELREKHAAETIDRTGCLICPGFIDMHVHFPQVDIIAAYGERLLEWLQKYTFPAESKFAAASHATACADFFVKELLRNGTTCALAFCTVHAGSVDALLERAADAGMMMICGKVMMDRVEMTPENLRDTAQGSYDDCKALIQRWHGTGRARYAITPRFAPTSTDLQLQLAGQLAREHPSVHVHTHLCENSEEVDLVKSLFNGRDYLGVYQDNGLVTCKSIFAHCVHVSQEHLQALAHAGSSIAFCPSSNSFLGSGLFPLERAIAAGVKVGLATDVGAGTSLSMLKTMGDAYKVIQLRQQQDKQQHQAQQQHDAEQLQQHSLSPLHLFHLATMGSAYALGIHNEVGSFASGSFGDFIVLDYASTDLMKRRMSVCETLEEKLFCLGIMGDERAVMETYIAGVRVHGRD